MSKGVEVTRIELTCVEAIGVQVTGVEVIGILMFFQLFLLQVNCTFHLLCSYLLTHENFVKSDPLERTQGILPLADENAHLYFCAERFSCCSMFINGPV
jgi:hypothetical protein